MTGLVFRGQVKGTSGADFRCKAGATREGLEQTIKDARKVQADLAPLLASDSINRPTRDQDQTAYDAAQGTIDKAQKALDAIKEGKKEAKAQDTETIALRHQLAELQTKELLGVAKINAERLATLEHLREENKLNATNIALVNQIAGVQAKLNFDKVLAQGKKNVAELSARSVAGENRAETFADKFQAAALLKSLRDSIKDDEKEIPEMLKAIGLGDATDADAVRKRLSGTIKANAHPENKTEGQAIQDDYSARKQAAEDIFQIETRHLDLIDDEGKRTDELARARKKYADEIYEAEVQHEEQLQAMRQKDLKEYEQFWTGLLNAGLQRDSSQALQKYLKSFGRGILDTVATNVTGLTFDTFSKLANTTALPGQTSSNGQLTQLGKILKGVPVLGASGAKQQGTQATEHLTSATDLLRGAVDKLTSVLTGKSNTAGGGVLKGIGGGLGIPTTDAAGNPISTDPGSGEAPEYNGLPGIGTNGDSANETGGGASGVASGLGGKLAAGAAIGGGVYQAITGFKKGSVSGIAQGVGGALATAAGIAALIPGGQVVAPFLAAAAGVADLVSAFTGQSKQQRQNNINSEISANAYLAPTSLNTMQSENGNFVSFDGRGNLRTSNYSAQPTVLEPYITAQRLNGAVNPTYYNAPGSVTAPLSGGPSPGGQAPVASTPQPIIIQAMDAQSFTKFARDNHMAIGEAFADHLQQHEGRASAQIRSAAGVE